MACKIVKHTHYITHQVAYLEKVAKLLTYHILRIYEGQGLNLLSYFQCGVYLCLPKFSVHFKSPIIAWKEQHMNTYRASSEHSYTR